MMSLWDALRMNMMISYQELVRTFLRKKINHIRKKAPALQGPFMFCFLLAANRRAIRSPPVQIYAFPVPDF
ncbi:hypothetical protein AGG97_21355 [Klebsiella michiganensis]|nr:hypothetical protein AGG97_21355 [Klebsiella michiganensis]